jgi:hypothetical protein
VILDRGRIVGRFRHEELSRDELVARMVALHEAGQLR